MSAKLEDARTQVHDLEKKHEDILLKVTDYENRIRSLCTEVQESQKEVNRLTDDLSQKVRLSLEQCHKFVCLLWRENITAPENKRLWDIKCATHNISFFRSFPFFPLPSFLSSIFFSPFLCKTFLWLFWLIVGYTWIVDLHTILFCMLVTFVKSSLYDDVRTL